MTFIIYSIQDYIKKTNKINEIRYSLTSDTSVRNSLKNTSFHKEQISKNMPLAITPQGMSNVPILNLQLSGIIMSTDPQKSHVIIGVSDAQKTYRINDSIDGFNGVYVRNINDNEIIVDNNGFQQKVVFFKTDELGTISQPDEPTDSIDILYTLSDFITINTVYNGHEIVGLRLNPTSRTKGFTNTGLKPGDIVIQWNNHSLTEVDDIKTVQNELKDQQSAQVTVRREKETFLINLKTADMEITKEPYTK